MKSVAVVVSIVFAAAAAGQQPPAGPSAARPVAHVNGEVITAEKLDTLYAGISPQMRAQYEKTGGKKAFLENYIAKRLLLQEAVKSGFDQRPDTVAALESARESALFDRYVREVVASEIVPDSAVRKFYDDNIDDFIVGEKVKVRHIVFTWKDRPQSEAREAAERVFSELQAHRVTLPPDSEENRELFRARFADAARRYSQDGVARDGGDLGWVERGRLDPRFEEVAFGMPAGIMSGIVATQFGYHIILVDDKKPAGAQPFEEVRRDIREYLLGQKQADIMSAVSRLTGELRRSSKVAVYPENLD